MKRLLSIAVIFITSISLLAQNDVTRFMGIPIDGFKPDMIRLLKAKGFVCASHDRNILEGEFNGTDVNIHVVTNNNKVYRIMVADARSINEADIKIRFNNLCHQFENNSRYMSLEDFTIPEDEDISYGMSVRNKRYQAYFYQYGTDTETETAEKMRQRCVWFMIAENFGKYYICLFYDNVLNQANGEDL